MMLPHTLRGNLEGGVEMFDTAPLAYMHLLPVRLNAGSGLLYSAAADWFMHVYNI